MAMPEELAAHCAANSTRVTLGTSLFVNALPVGSTGYRVAIFEGPGDPPAFTFGAGSTTPRSVENLPAYENPSIQVIGRTTAPSSGATVPFSSGVRHALLDCWTVLGSVVNETISSTFSNAYYLRVTPTGSPGYIGEESDGSQLYGFNCDVMRKPHLTPFST